MKTETGVYFRREDYAPFWTRLMVDIIDILAFSVLWLALIVPLMAFSDANQSTFNIMTLISIAIAIFYFVVLKRSRFRTLGYQVGRVRIVGLDGQPPSYWSLILRLMFGFFGPLSWPIDLIWMSNDANRQALRDKFASTYVIKAKSQPAGQGPVILQYYEILFYNFLLREVETDRADGVVPPRG